jgi:hypothetical protein
MPLATIPAVDANICSGWTEQNINLYNRLDFYLAKKQVDRRKWYATWGKFLGKVKWTPNMGDTMRTVVTEPSPHIRQFAFPNPISTASPKKDVIDIRERKMDDLVYRHRFESLVLNFVPDFRDFMSHVNDNSKDIMEKEERFEDIFYRGRIFHNSPFVWIPNNVAGELVASPVGVGNAAGTDGKTTAWLQAQMAAIGNPGYLSMESLNKALTVAENDIGNLPFSGPDVPKEDNGMMNKYALVTSTEAFNQFSLDPFLLNYKNCYLDIINGRFQGSLFGRLTTILEKFPLRMAADGTFPAPEIRELNPDAYNYQESVPNPAYYGIAQAPYEIAFLVGADGYDVIEVGPPPAAFASNGMPQGFGKMFWNGEVQLTKNFLVPCQQDDGTIIWQTNNYGEHLMFISQVTYGMRGYQKRNIVPIIFKRKRGI